LTFDLSIQGALTAVVADILNILSIQWERGKQHTRPNSSAEQAAQTFVFLNAV
jgi:hypothetical protein